MDYTNQNLSEPPYKRSRLGSAVSSEASDNSLDDLVSFNNELPDELADNASFSAHSGFDNRSYTVVTHGRLCCPLLPPLALTPAPSSVAGASLLQSPASTSSRSFMTSTSVNQLSAAIVMPQQMQLPLASSPAIPLSSSSALPLASSSITPLASSLALSLASSSGLPLASSSALYLVSSSAIPLASSLALPLSSSSALPLASSLALPLASSLALPLASSLALPLVSSLALPLASTSALPLASSLALPLASSLALPLASSLALPLASSLALPLASSLALPLESSSAPLLASSSAILSRSAVTGGSQGLPVGDWRRNVTQGLRDHLVQKIAVGIYPPFDQALLLDIRLMSLLQYAHKVEGDMFERANSREDYYHLVAEKIYKVQKDLEDKRRARLEQGSSNGLVQRMNILRQKLRALQPQSSDYRFEVSREQVFEDSHRHIKNMEPEDLRRRLMVKFLGEEGIDHGGVAREWLHLLSHKMLDPDYGLFQYSCDDIYTLQINPNSGIHPEHLSYFHFVGRIIGIAIFHGHYLDGGFTMPFYKQLLGKPITLDDLESVDPDLHRSLVWILNNDITGSNDQDFCVDHEAYGERIVHDLKPGGRDIPVTEENKEEYVKLYVNWHLVQRTTVQFVDLQKGLSEVIPQHLLQPFDERELQLIISGLGKIDVEDWKKNTCLQQCTLDSNIVKWFWRAVEEFDEERRARLLQFVTGSSRVPFQGFKALQGSARSQAPCLFTIHQVDANTDNLPLAHTCFNLIDIPPYESYGKFLDKLTRAVEETCGFMVE